MTAISIDLDWKTARGTRRMIPQVVGSLRILPVPSLDYGQETCTRGQHADIFCRRSFDSSSSSSTWCSKGERKAYGKICVRPPDMHIRLTIHRLRKKTKTVRNPQMRIMLALRGGRPRSPPTQCRTDHLFQGGLTTNFPPLDHASTLPRKSPRSPLHSK